MSMIEIDGVKYKVGDRLGYNPDIGGYVATIRTEQGEKKVVKVRGGQWRFWTPKDRVAPLVDAISRRARNMT